MWRGRGPLLQRCCGVGQGGCLGGDLAQVTCFEGGFQTLDQRFHGANLFRTGRGAQGGQRFAGRMDLRLGLVACLRHQHQRVVAGRVEFGVLDHRAYLRFRQAGVRLDGDAVLLAAGLVLGADVQDAVGVNVEADIDLRCAAGRWRDTFEVELAERLVAGGQLALPLVDLDRHRRLVVFRRREHLAELGRYRRIFYDHLGHHAAHGLDAERQGGDVEQQQVLAVARQHGTLDRRADGHRFIGIDVLARILAEELLDLLLHLGHARHAADQYDVVDLGYGDAGVLDRRAARCDGRLNQLVDQRLQPGAREGHAHVDGSAVGHRDVGFVDVGLQRRRQLDLGTLGRGLDALQGDRIFLQVDAVDALEVVDDVVDDALVEVLAAKEGVAIGREHLELLLAVERGDLDDRDVEGAAAEVVHGDLAVALLVLVHAEGQRGGGRLVDDALDVQARDAARILGGLALGVIEVGRHGDDGLADRLAEIVLGRLLHLAQHLGRDLRRRHFFAAHADPGVTVVSLDDLERHQAYVLLHFLFVEFPADQALDGIKRVARIGDSLPLGGGPDQNFAIVLVGNDGWRGARAFRVFDDLGHAVFHYCHAGIGSTQIDADDFAHDVLLLVLSLIVLMRLK